MPASVTAIDWSIDWSLICGRLNPDLSKAYGLAVTEEDDDGHHYRVKVFLVFYLYIIHISLLFDYQNE